MCCRSSSSGCSSSYHHRQHWLNCRSNWFWYLCDGTWMTRQRFSSSRYLALCLHNHCVLNKHRCSHFLMVIWPLLVFVVIVTCWWSVENDSSTNRPIGQETVATKWLLCHLGR